MLKELFEDNTQYVNTIEFSQAIYGITSKLAIKLPFDFVNGLYLNLRDALPKQSKHQVFLKSGLNFYKKNRNSEYLNLTPNSIYIIRAICNDAKVECPAWLPLTFEDPKSQVYYLDWSTVNTSFIPDIYASLFRGRIEFFKKQGAKMPIADKKSVQHIPESKVEIAILKEPEFSRYVAKKYLALLDSANKRGVLVKLTVSELHLILSNPRCYFTGEQLCYFPHDKVEQSSNLPINYLTLDRLDSNLGYSIENTVVCGRAINVRKGMLSVEAFKRKLAMEEFLNTTSLAEDQKSLLKQMLQQDENNAESLEIANAIE